MADGNTISPRTLLSSTPSSRVADNLEVSSAILPGQVAFETDPFSHRLSMFGNDALENFRIWGNNWGELTLRDFQPANNVTAMLTANFGSGGEMDLFTTGGAPQISLNAGNSGDASAILPTDAVNSGEILDEPGVSNRDYPSFFFMSTGNGTYVVDSVDITIPAAGYVEVTCGGFLFFNGSAGEIDLVSGQTRGVFDFVPGWAAAYIGTVGSYAIPATSTRLYAEGSPGTKRYYLHLNNSSGSSSNYAGSLYIRAKYYPTLYGTVALAKEGTSTSATGALVAPGNRSQSVAEAELTTITVEDHNAQLEAERAKQISELEARIKRLEGQMAGQLSGNAGTPRKER